jgi:hypothetical protein
LAFPNHDGKGVARSLFSKLLVMYPLNKWTLDKNSVGQAIAVCGLSSRE